MSTSVWEVAVHVRLSGPCSNNRTARPVAFKDCRGLRVWSLGTIVRVWGGLLNMLATLLDGGVG